MITLVHKWFAYSSSSSSSISHYRSSIKIILYFIFRTAKKRKKTNKRKWYWWQRWHDMMIMIIPLCHDGVDLLLCRSSIFKYQLIPMNELSNFKFFSFFISLLTTIWLDCFLCRFSISIPVINCCVYSELSQIIIIIILEIQNDDDDDDLWQLIDFFRWEWGNEKKKWRKLSFLILSIIFQFPIDENFFFIFFVKNITFSITTIVFLFFFLSNTNRSINSIQSSSEHLFQIVLRTLNLQIRKKIEFKSV